MRSSIKLIFWSTLILYLGLLTSCVSEESSARQRITEITSIEVPNNSTMIYYYKDEVFVNGRRAQYTVFSFEEKPTEFLSDYIFKKGRNNDIELDFVANFGFMTIDTEDIPSEYLPNWNNEYLYLLDTTNVYFIFFTNIQLLMVYIVGS